MEASRPDKEWEQLSYSWEFETGDKLRTKPHSFAELSLLPDTYLRLDSESEISFEQLSNDLISLKLLRGSAILDVARYESKELLPIKLAGPSTSVALVGEGNYRIDIKPSGDRITVREGKVIFNKSVVSSCRVISGGTVSECEKHRTDNFDFWSEHRGEGNERSTFGMCGFGNTGEPDGYGLVKDACQHSGANTDRSQEHQYKVGAGSRQRHPCSTFGIACLPERIVRRARPTDHTAAKRE